MTSFDEDQIVGALLIKAETQGYVIIDDILELLPDNEDNFDLIEQVIAALEEASVKVQDPSVQEEEEADKLFLLSNESSDEEEDDDEDDDDLPYDNDDLAAISVDDGIGLYLREMTRVPLLTNEEEVHLAKAIERSRAASRSLTNKGTRATDAERHKYEAFIEEGRRAREHLIKANTRLVVSIAKKYMGRGVPFLDLIQEGNLGLMKSVEKFNYKLGFRFSTYATWWIRQTITRAIADQSRTIRVPVHMNDRIRRLYKVTRELEQSLGRAPSPAEVATELGIDSEQVEWMLKVSWRPLSLEQPIGEEEDNEFGSFVEDENTPSPSQTVYENLLKDKIEEVLNTLSPREQRILRLRFGLVNGRCYTLEEVGQKFGLTRERIRQIEARALRRLRHPRRSKHLKDYLS
ncbi:MAG: sigma-70 family RNA polymerase sigma factor [Chloroflexi bacterium]|nr:sigma-70 family RNA polymerase sigma factor [Chloroflexota bacterium]